jgi:hypothetical protein
MHASADNASQNPAPFVDQLPNGPGVSKIDPSDPAAPMYRLLAKMRSPVTLRDLMIHPVRTGYIGQEQPLAAADLPKSAAELYPEVGVSEVAVPSPAGRIRCQVFSPPASNPAGRSARDDALPSRRRFHPRSIGGHRLHHEQDRGRKRGGGRERQLPPRAGVAVSGVP